MSFRGVSPRPARSNMLSVIGLVIPIVYQIDRQHGKRRGYDRAECCSARSSTRTWDVPRIWSETPRPASPRSSTRSGTSSPTCGSRAFTGCESLTWSRPTTTPTTCPATAGSPGRLERRSTSASWPTAEYPHEPLADGAVIELGEVEVEAIHTPGHRPEHTSLLLRDRGRGGEPWAVLTGDSLFVGDVARPDLAIEPREGAREIYASLPSGSSPFPTASRSGPGTSAAPPAAAPASTTRPPRRSDSSAPTTGRAQFDRVEDFVADAVDGLGEPPPNVEHVVAINRGPLVEEMGAPAPLRRGASRSRSPRARCWSTPGRTSSSTRPISRERSPPLRTTPASRRRWRRWCPLTQS